MSEANENDSNFGLIRSFGIDDGELDDESKPECFVLGYELAQVDAAIESGAAMSRLIHVENRDRIEAHVIKHRRLFRWTYMHDDISESWLQFDMEAE